MLRRFGLLLILAGAAWAEDPDWIGGPVEDNRRRSADDDQILNQDIEDWIDRKEVDNVGYPYDHFEIWDKPYFEISLGVWASQLSGPITLGGTDVVDLSDGLGLNEVDPSPMWGINVRNAWWEVILDGFSADLNGTTNINVDIELPTTPPTPIMIGDVIASQLIVQNLRLLGGWRVYRRPAFTVSLLLGISAYRVKGFIRAVAANAQTSFDVVLPIPVFGISFYGRFGKDRRWEYRAEFVGIAISASTFGGNVVDTRLTVGYRVVDWFVVRAGYRYANIGAFFEGIRVDFELQGPFLEVVGEF